MADIVYTPTNWQDSPATTSPIAASRLNNLETGVGNATTQANQALRTALGSQTYADAKALTGTATIVTAGTFTAQPNKLNPVNPPSGGTVATLPSASGIAGTPMTISHVGTQYTVTMTGPTVTLNPGDQVRLLSDGTNWQVDIRTTSLAGANAYTDTAVATLDTRLQPSIDGTGTSIVTTQPSDLARALRFLFFYGNSEFADNGNASVNAADKMITVVQPQNWFNGSVSGSTMADVVSYAFGSVAGTRAGSARGISGSTAGSSTFVNQPFLGALLLLKGVRNDSRRDTVTTGAESTAATQVKSRAGFTNHLDAAIRLFRARARVPNLTGHNVSTAAGSPTVGDPSILDEMRGMTVTDNGAGKIPTGSYIGTIVRNAANAIIGFNLSSSATSQVNVNATASTSGTPVLIAIQPQRTGTWQIGQTAPGSTNGVVAYSSTAGSVTTYIINLTAAAPVSWATLGLDDDAIGLTGATYSITVDGGTAITGTTSKQSKKSATGPNYGYGQITVPLGTLAAGFHTIAITHAGTSGQYLYDDTILVESATPPTVALVKAYQLPTAGYAAVGGSWATDQVYNGLVDTVAARFPADGSVKVWDPMETGSGFDNTTMIGNTDGLSTHLNDLGEGWAYRWLMSKVNKLTARAGLVRL